MPGRRSASRLARWAAAGGVISAVAMAGFASPAGAVSPPPWVPGPLQPGQWIAYTLSTTSPPVFQRNPTTLWGPVSLNRQGNLAPSALASEPGPNGQPGWPSNWSAGGVNLKRADQFCDIGASSCQYYVTSGAGGQFFFGATGGGQTPDLNQFNQGFLALTQPATLGVDLNNVPATGTTSSGPFAFSAVVTDGIPGSHTFRWTLTSPSGTIDTKEGQDLTSYQPPSSVFSQNGQYCVTLLVTASDGSTASKGPACFAVSVSTPTPPPAVQPPASPPAAPPAAGGSTPAPAAPLSFAHALPNFATPVPGAVQQVTVIWLWKPDWFQATSSGAGKDPKTAGQPKAVQRASVSVDRTTRHASPSAAPWLAGLGAFGMFGAGWLAFRRRQLRTSLLD